MPRSPEGPPPPPVVQKLRLEYAKRGRLRFSSHRDFQRALERALRRAAIPMAYSAGFHPHPKISFANAAPTGTASEAEYLELGLADYRDPDLVRQALDESLPPGLDILRVVPGSGLALADRLEASDWLVELPTYPQVRVAAVLAQFMAAPAFEVQRPTKTGLRALDARAAVISAEIAGQTIVAGQVIADSDGCGLSLRLRHLTPTVRPTEILLALATIGQWEQPVTSRATRLRQGPLVGAEIGDPLA